MVDRLHQAFDGMAIVCMSSAGWETDTPVNVHHIMRRLSHDHPILWVDSMPLRVPSASRSDIRKVYRRLRTSAGGIRKLQDNMWGITPRSLPLYRYNWIREWNERRLRKRIRNTRTSLGFARSIMWAFLPTAAGVAGNLDEGLIIYHCVDDYAANPGVDGQMIVDMERALLDKADVVFATSPPLQRALAKYHGHVHLMPVGVDEVFLQIESYAEPGDLVAVPRPRIGFTGAISGYKVNIPLLMKAAEGYPDVSFVLIGPAGEGDPSTDISTLRRMRNVYLMGSRRHQDLPGYLYYMDALMLPSADTVTMKSSFPAKLFEYMATGKPVIAMRQEPLAPYDALVNLAESESDFISGIRGMLEDNDLSKREARVEVARQNTWEVRMASICDVVEDALIRKQGSGR